MSHIEILEAASMTLTPTRSSLPPNDTKELDEALSCNEETTDTIMSSCKAPSHRALSSPILFTKEQKTKSVKSLDGKSNHSSSSKILVHNLDVAALNQRLVVINLSRRGLTWSDGNAICTAMALNPHLTVLKLSYNFLGNRGVAVIAGGFIMNDKSKHPSLKVLDLGFNSIGDAGCATLALYAVSHNFTLSTLYLSGNYLNQKGAIALAGAILQGCNLSELHLSANSIGEIGVQALAQAIAERESLSTSLDNRSYDTMQKLYLVGIEMGHEGVVTLSRMLLNNYSIRTLCLSNNGIDDNDLALLSQSLSRNRKVPLEVIQLSFNEITCAGLECFMNAVWGWLSLKEIRIDNNKIKDRGAQLAAVALTSINLEVVDISFNKVTTVGIKALMKSLSENASLRYLGLSGIQIDSNAAKALSYGLAYNSTLRYLHIDNCAIGYAGQRHIIAGVASNRLVSLRILTGFSIGAIAATLGLPKELERWTNDQCLSFIRIMWKQWRRDNIPNNRYDNQGKTDMLIGPAPAPVVKRAAQMAIQIIGIDGASCLNTEDHQKDVSESSPLVRTNDMMLEKSKSGTLIVPTNVQNDEKLEVEGSYLHDISSKRKHMDAEIKITSNNKNIKWLRFHFQSLYQIGQLPFNENDLQQLHQYFFAPIVQELHSDHLSQDTVGNRQPQESMVNTLQHENDLRSHCQMPSDKKVNASFSRAISFKRLGDARDAILKNSSTAVNRNCARRRTLETMEKTTDSSLGFCKETEPASKRAKNFRPRIAYYPRIRQLLEDMKNEQAQKQMLAVMRKLKFVESIMLQGRNIYANDMIIKKADHSTPSDVEMIILDLL